MRAVHDLGYEPALLIDATAAFAPAQQEYFVEHIAHHFGRLVSGDEFMNLVKHRKAEEPS